MLRPLAIFLLCAVPALAEPGPFASVIAEVEKIQAEAGFRSASLGFCVVELDAEDAAPPAGYRIDTSLIPASTMKLITTATAVEVLGGDFRFETALEHTGSISEEGVLNGNIVIAGGGDPTLGSSRISTTFAKWQTALGAAGITRVKGSVVGDASVFGTQLIPDSWQWDDIGNYYASGACGLTFHQNRFFCRFRTSSPGAPATLIGTDPRLPSIQLVNEMRVGAAGSGDKGFVYGNPYGKIFYLRGTVPAGGSSYTIKGALPDPAFFCARAFTKHLNENGLPVSGDPSTVRLLRIAGKSLGERTELYTQQSAPLSSLLVLTNQKSNNLRAESIHRMIGVRLRENGSTAAAAEAVTAHWKAKGIDLTGFKMTDGCGLARANMVTPRQMVAILQHAAKFEDFETLYASLPVAGRSGTLKSIGGGSSAEGRIHAKSGTLDGIKNYAGYAEASSGNRYAFAIFVNNYTCDLWQVKSAIVRVWRKLVAL